MRTTDEILQIINDEANSHGELYNLQQNTASVSWWKFLKNIFALSSQALEIIVEQNKKEIEELVLSIPVVGSLEWYKDICLKYQHGDVLQIVDNKPQYAAINPDKQIIKKIFVEEIFDTLQGSSTFGNFYLHFYFLKTRYDGQPILLSEEEISAFRTYLHKMKILGTNLVDIYSNFAHVMCQTKVQVRKEYFNADGSTLADGKLPVIDVIRNHINGLYDNHKFSVQEIIARIKKIDGVVACDIDKVLFSGWKNMQNSSEIKVGDIVEIRDTESNMRYFSFVPVGNDDILNQFVSYELV